MQLDGFGSDSVRLVRDLRRDAQQPVQFLLFSATFNERVKNYALRVTTDEGREEVNQVHSPAIISRPCRSIICSRQFCHSFVCSAACKILQSSELARDWNTAVQFFVPREDLSLEVIKQYQVVRAVPAIHPCTISGLQDLLQMPAGNSQKVDMSSSCIKAPAPERVMLQWRRSAPRPSTRSWS